MRDFHTRIAGGLACAVLLVSAWGCGLSRQAPFATVTTDYAIVGHVSRGGVPAAGQVVRLYDQYETVLFDSVTVDAAGDYHFAEAPAGSFTVRASSTAPDDFAYVRYIFTRPSAAEHDSVPPLDMASYGCAQLAPAAGDTVSMPDIVTPLTFQWQAMSIAPDARYKVRIADAQDSTVWESVRDAATSTDWNGFGTGSVYAGDTVPPGTYLWRVKARLANGVQAATAKIEMTLRAPAGGASP